MDQSKGFPPIFNNSRQRSSCAEMPCRHLTIIRWMFAVVFSAFVYYSLSPVFDWDVLLNAACQAVLVVIGYLLYPIFAGNFGLGITGGTAKVRYTSLDLLRVIAVILVMLFHYIINIGYYGWNADSMSFVAVSFLRWFASTCCPLFMLLTGYFAINKQVELKSWKAVPSFLFSYFILSIMHVCYLRYVGATVDLSYVKQLVNMNAFWYVNMHFGLMLIAPFCNVAWDNLTCRYKQILIFVLFVLSSFGTITDGFFTQYWYGLYPLLYYFIGGYIRQYNIKANRPFAVGSIFVIIALQTIYTYFVAEGSVFDWGVNYGGYSSGYNATPTVIVASLVMIVVKDITIENKYVNYILLQISKNSLVIYLANS